MKASDFTYELPEGYYMRPDLRQKLDTLVEETGLSNAHAQDFINLHVELMEEYASALQSQAEHAAAIKDGVE